MKPIITIIIATFNSERFIQSALESVKNQSFQDWENEPAEGRENGGFWYVSGWGRGR